MEQLTYVGAMASKHNRRNGYVNIGAGRPPVQLQLAKKVESGVFIEMADLLPERLGDKQKGYHRSKHSKQSLSIRDGFNVSPLM